jgi:actin-related protein
VKKKAGDIVDNMSEERRVKKKAGDIVDNMSEERRVKKKAGDLVDNMSEERRKKKNESDRDRFRNIMLEDKNNQIEIDFEEKCLQLQNQIDIEDKRLRFCENLINQKDLPVTVGPMKDQGNAYCYIL